jgi:5-methylcytosine-specific restriction protein A
MANTTEQRGTAAQRGYGYRWQKAREGWLRKHPLCAMHTQMGRVVPAVVVDHITPHRGDQALFWDKGNWQSLCKQCHDAHKQRQEKGGTSAACNLSGLPTDPKHHWFKTTA